MRLTLATVLFASSLVFGSAAVANAAPFLHYSVKTTLGNKPLSEVSTHQLNLLIQNCGGTQKTEPAIQACGTRLLKEAHLNGDLQEITEIHLTLRSYP